MYTSVTDNSLKTGMRYLAASLIIAAAAAVYGLFSHGVYSYFMTYAFMIPLLAGALPHLITAMRSGDSRGTGNGPMSDETPERAEPSRLTKMFDAKDAQLAFIATLTAGSLLKGVLDIYGTTNRLLIAYPVIAALMLAAILTAVIKNKK